MERFERAFAKIKDGKQKALSFYITAGDPDLATTKEVVIGLAREGLTLCEIGIPFSDPVADGPTIQMAAARALRNGTTIKKIWETTAEIRAEAFDLPLVYLTYFNLLVSYGVREFLLESKKAGVDGLIIPDLPWEESQNYAELFSETGLVQIQLLAPTTSDERMAAIAKQAKGFLYCVSVTGVTGIREELPPELSGFIKRVKKHARIPVLVGFGISTPEQARAIVSAGADGIIAGSKVVDLLWKNGGKPGPVYELARSFAGVLAAGG